MNERDFPIRIFREDIFENTISKSSLINFLNNSFPYSDLSPAKVYLKHKYGLCSMSDLVSCTLLITPHWQNNPTVGLFVELTSFLRTIEHQNLHFGSTRQIPHRIYLPTKNSSLRVLSAQFNEKMVVSEFSIALKLGNKFTNGVKVQLHTLSAKENQGIFKSENQEGRISNGIQIFDLLLEKNKDPTTLEFFTVDKSEFEIDFKSSDVLVHAINPNLNKNIDFSFQIYKRGFTENSNFIFKEFYKSISENKMIQSSKKSLIAGILDCSGEIIISKKNQSSFIQNAFGLSSKKSILTNNFGIFLLNCVFFKFKSDFVESINFLKKLNKEFVNEFLEIKVEAFSVDFSFRINCRKINQFIERFIESIVLYRNTISMMIMERESAEENNISGPFQTELIYKMSQLDKYIKSMIEKPVNQIPKISKEEKSKNTFTKVGEKIEDRFKNQETIKLSDISKIKISLGGDEKRPQGESNMMGHHESEVIQKADTELLKILNEMVLNKIINTNQNSKKNRFEIIKKESNENIEIKELWKSGAIKMQAFEYYEDLKSTSVEKLKSENTSHFDKLIKKASEDYEFEIIKKLESKIYKNKENSEEKLELIEIQEEIIKIEENEKGDIFDIERELFRKNELSVQNELPELWQESNKKDSENNEWGRTITFEEHKELMGDNEPIFEDEAIHQGMSFSRNVSVKNQFNKSYEKDSFTEIKTNGKKSMVIENKNFLANFRNGDDFQINVRRRMTTFSKKFKNAVENERRISLISGQKERYKNSLIKSVKLAVANWVIQQNLEVLRKLLTIEDGRNKNVSIVNNLRPEKIAFVLDPTKIKTYNLNNLIQTATFIKIGHFVEKKSKREIKIVTSSEFTRKSVALSTEGRRMTINSCLEDFDNNQENLKIIDDKKSDLNVMEKITNQENVNRFNFEEKKENSKKSECGCYENGEIIPAVENSVCENISEREINNSTSKNKSRISVDVQKISIPSYQEEKESFSKNNKNTDLILEIGLENESERNNESNSKSLDEDFTNGKKKERKISASLNLKNEENENSDMTKTQKIIFTEKSGYLSPVFISTDFNRKLRVAAEVGRKNYVKHLDIGK